jgi:AraC-like DNA-binding protein
MASPRGVEQYVRSVLAYDVALPGPGTHRGMPGTGLVLELPMDAPLDVGWLGVPESRRSTWSTVSGLHLRPAVIRHDGRLRGVSIHLTCAGVRAVLGLPLGELRGQILALEDVAPHLAHLPEAVADAPAAADQTVRAAIEAALAADRAPEPPPGVLPALRRIAAGAPVGAVAREVGWSRRHLQDLVRTECGASPRDVRRLARLSRSRRALAERPAARLADVAATSGYADHAHMTHEWRELAGCTPTQWRHDELPWVQDVASRRAEDWTPSHRHTDHGG